MVNAAIEPPTKVGVRNSERSNIGCGERASAITKPTSSTHPVLRQAITPVSPQPCPDTRMKP